MSCGVTAHADWESYAPFWIRKCREGEANREGMLDDWMLKTLGSVAGLKIVDLGCGEGRFCRILSRLGASNVLGIDSCERLILEARKQCTSDVERYIVGNIENLDSVESCSFQVAVSYVTLVDVLNLDAVSRSTYRVLDPGGRFVACNLAPMATSANERIGEPDGSRVAIRVDNYFDESTRVMRFRGGHRLKGFHRTLSTHVNAFLKTGFVLRGIHEPLPTTEGIGRYPELMNELRAPSFVIFDLKKPAHQASNLPGQLTGHPESPESC